MKKNNQKTLKTIGIIISVLILLFFVRFALGEFLAGWNSVN
jgi:hypothetical protein